MIAKLPDLDRALEHAGTALGAWTYLLAAVMAFAETGAFLGFIAPGETIVLVGGMVAGQGTLNLAALIATVWSCAVLGDIVSFELGRRRGRDLLIRHGRRLRITPERIGKVEAQFAKRGGWAILVGRFIGFVRPLAPFLAGSSGMPLRQFLAFDIVAAGAWSVTFSVLGFVFWQSLDQVLDIAKTGSLLLGLVVVAATGASWLVRWLCEPVHRASLAQHRAMRPIVATGRQIRRSARRPAAFLAGRLTPGDLGLELTAVASAVAVGAFAFVAYLTTVADGTVTFGDRRAAAWVDAVAAPWLTHIAKVVTSFGAFEVVLIAVLVGSGILVARRRLAEAATLVAGLLLTAVLTQLVKATVERPRPTGSLVHTIGWSFPSGHSSNAVAWLALGLVLWRTLPAWPQRAAAVAGAALTVGVGLSRIYLRAHWWSDVAAGWGLGVAVYGICGAAAITLDHRRRRTATLPI